MASGKNESMRNTILFDLESVSQLKIKNNKKADCIYCKGKHTVKKDDFEIVKNDLVDVEYDLIEYQELING